MGSSHARRRRVGVVSLLALAGVFVPVTTGDAKAPPTVACERRDNNEYAKLLECVRLGGVREHQAALQAIADVNGKTRAAQTPGYAASVAYVEDVMRGAGWAVDVVEFTYPSSIVTLQQLTPVNPPPYATGGFTFTGEGDVTGAVIPVDIDLENRAANTSGCQASDFLGLDFSGPTDIALIQRGNCNFSVKAANADAAGAEAVIIFNQGDSVNPGDRFSAFVGTLGTPGLVDIPVVGASFAAGEALAQAGSTAHVVVQFVTRTSYNVIAELRGVNDGNVVMAGAHLDSVPAGPGINDNGSGTAALLELGEQLSGHVPQNTLRFAWWGAEEIGLLGSTAWVNGLSATELDRIALYLNFDMIGSPNYVFQVYDADESSFPAPAGVPIPEGSEAIEKVFESYYTWAGEPYDDSQFSGRSDYQAFIVKGIPSSGLFTGAEVPKTALQASIWGGTAGVAFDPCYHAACDTYANNNDHALAVNADAVAFAVLTYAHSTESVNGVPGRPVPGDFVVPAPAGPEGTFATGGGGLSPDDHDVPSS